MHSRLAFLLVCFIQHKLNDDCILRIDNCDERRIYKSEDISGPKGDIYMFNTSPKSLDFCLSNDVW